MQKLHLAAVASALIMAIGCTQGTPGGPGVQNQTKTTERTVESTRNPETGRAVTESHTTSKPVVTNSRETFSMSVPVLATSVQQNESKQITISLHRGSDFNEDVSLRFSAIPEGVTITPASPMIKGSESEAKIDVTADAAAPVGEFTVKVTGHPMKNGMDAENEFKINVTAK